MRDPLIKKVAGTMNKYCLVKKNQKIFLSFSGGMDSTVLFHVLDSQKNSGGFSICLLHINHNIRKESSREERWAAEFSAAMGAPLVIRRLKPDNRSSSCSLEEWAHHERYRLYESMLKQYPGSLIATAHHSGDNLETLLLSLFKGNIGHPFCGMSMKTGSIIRPLLHVSKEEICDFAKKFGLSYITDPSNDDLSFERNFLRHAIIPGIEERFGGIHSRISQITSRYALQKDYLDSMICSFIDKHCTKSPGKILMDLDSYKKLHTALKYEAIRRILFMIYRSNKIVSYRLVSEIFNYIDKKKGNVSMPGDAKCLVSGRYLAFLTGSET